jgi:uncharacterized protein DUF2760
LHRFLLALKALWRILTEPDFARRVEGIWQKTPEGADLRVLAILQRDGRLIDFLKENLDEYSDAQIGASVREIHRDCRKALDQYIAIDPIMAGPEGESVALPNDFDPATVRLTGQVPDRPPFQGVLKHHGWKVRSVQLPVLPEAQGDTSILAPAEVHIP